MHFTFLFLIETFIISEPLQAQKYLQVPPLQTQYFIEVPENQTVTEGDNLLLRCQVGNRQGVVQWTRNGFAMGKTKELIDFGSERL